MTTTTFSDSVVVDSSDQTHTPLKVYGTWRDAANHSALKYLTMMAPQCPGLQTNGAVTINGDVGDPIQTNIVNNVQYMLGIKADVRPQDTCILIKSGQGCPYITAYDGSNNVLFKVSSTGFISLSGGDNTGLYSDQPRRAVLAAANTSGTLVNGLAASVGATAVSGTAAADTNAMVAVTGVGLTRILVGPRGSGPVGGTSRALYVDFGS